MPRALPTLQSRLLPSTLRPRSPPQLAQHRVPGPAARPEPCALLATLSAAHVEVQPAAAELGHLPCHGHARDVSRALSPRLSPRHAARTPRSPAASRPPGPQPTEPTQHRLHCLAATLRTANGQVQPAVELGHVPSNVHEPHVLRARAPRSAVAFTPRHDACTAQLATYRVPLLATLGTVCDGLQPAAPLGHVPRHKHGPYVRGARLTARALPPESAVAPSRCTHARANTLARAYI